MKSHTIGRPLWALLACVTMASAFAQDVRPGSPVCSVALPPKCAPTGRSDAVVDSLSVTEIQAAGEQECVDKARELVARCPDGSGARSLARYRQGPADKLHELAGGGGSSRAQALASSGGRPRTEVTLPIVYGRNFEAEFDQFGYSPDFKPGAMSFDSDGRMLVRSGNYLQIRGKDGKWVFVDLSTAAAAAIQRVPDVAGFRWALDTRSANADLNVYVDARNRWYTLVQGMSTRLKADNAVSLRPYLLASSDGGTSWTAIALTVPDGRPSWRATIEHNDGNTDRSGPPPVLTFDQSEREAERSRALFLWTFKWDGGNLGATQTRISDRSILVDNHSGGANSLVSTAERIYVTYPGVADPKAPGTPAHLVIFDKSKGAVDSESVLAQAGGASSADNHNIPGICVGRDRALHVLLPGHQEDLRMLSGRIGGDGRATFGGEPQIIGEPKTRAGGYTYGSLSCDAAGNVFVTSRWAGDRYRFQLVLLRRLPQGEWQSWGRLRHLVMVDPGRPFYGTWRQKTALNGSGQLHIYYAYYANQLSAAEMGALKSRFPFENWKQAKEVTPPQCVSGGERRCWAHPMPEVTSVMLATDAGLKAWRFVP
jgi:hypothetical protein